MENFLAGNIKLVVHFLWLKPTSKRISVLEACSQRDSCFCHLEILLQGQQPNQCLGRKLWHHNRIDEDRDPSLGLRLRQDSSRLDFRSRMR